jgi:hypothetical protein
MKRRTFLKITAAAFPMITTSCARLRGANAPSNRVTLAAIGMGNRATSLNLNEIASQRSDVQYLAVCDPMKDRRELGKQQLEHFSGQGSVTAYKDFREVLARDDIDGVVIATPDHWHVPIAIAAARAGKDMYVEKPLGVSMRWNNILRKEVKRNKCIFQYGTQQRGQENVWRGCELVRNGYIGELKHIEVWSPHLEQGYNAPVEPAEVPAGFDYNLWLGPAPEAQYTARRCSAEGAYHIYDYAIGYIAGWGAHPLDVAQWGKGADTTPPVFYEGNGIVNDVGLFDTTTIWDIRCEYTDGVTMRFMSAANAKTDVMKYRPWQEDGTTFHGTDGWVSVSRGGTFASDPELLNIEFEEEDRKLKRTTSTQGDFIDCIKNRKATATPVGSAVDSDAISHLSDIAVRTGRPIRWDPKKQIIIGDNEAARYLDRPMRAPWKLEDL